jgi:hypothetical protein
MCKAIIKQGRSSKEFMNEGADNGGDTYGKASEFDWICS